MMLQQIKQMGSFLVMGFLMTQIPICVFGQAHKKTPNILFAIADDQSYPHASVYGKSIYKTPVFDSIAQAGVLFKNAFAAAPQCSPSRAALLTGRQIWELEEAGTHASLFPKKFPVFTDAIESVGYFIGYTGKPWDPGNFKDAGWVRNPVGPEYNKRQWANTPTKGISKTDYVANFKHFLQDKPSDKPFFFWFGSQEPHRVYEQGSGKASGLNIDEVIVPPFLPNNDVVRNDLLDYALEIQWFDQQLGKMLTILKERGELDNTIVIITADNGMPFPYAKANLQEFGTHVPLTMAGPSIKKSRQQIETLVGLIDLAPTILEIAGAPALQGIAGTSLLPLLKGSISDKKLSVSKPFVFTGRERHSHARPDNLGYPARSIRTAEYLLIENFKTDRWPLGDPAPAKKTEILSKGDMKPILEGYEDIDDSPTKSYMVQNKALIASLFQMSFEKRNAFELYNIKKDPYCMNDISGNADVSIVLDKLKQALHAKLKEQSDPRMTGNGDVFDSYPRFGLMRPFDGFKERAKYNPAYKQ
jgi:uncharacterized sulfatase